MGMKAMKETKWLLEKKHWVAIIQLRWVLCVLKILIRIKRSNNKKREIVIFFILKKLWIKKIKSLSAPYRLKIMKKSYNFPTE